MSTDAGNGCRRLICLLLFFVSPLAHATVDSTSVGRRTTDGNLALNNLDAQIAGVERLGQFQPLAASDLARLAELLMQRGRIVGSIADYERAAALANAATSRFERSREGFVLRAKVNALFHRFPAALLDIDRAESLGQNRFACDGMRASIYQALGRYDEALTIRRRQRDAVGDPATIAALASVLGERGEVETAGELFEEALRRYRDVSPIFVAELYFDEGRMWMEARNWSRARERLTMAVETLPGFVPARGHLAEVEAELGDRSLAIARLAGVAERGDDPDCLAQLARIGGDPALFDRAARRYGELVSRYPEAFSDHAAELWLAHPEGAARALALAQTNLAVRQTPHAYELAIRAASRAAPGEVAELCHRAEPLLRFSVSLAAACAG